MICVHITQQSQCALLPFPHTDVHIFPKCPPQSSWQQATLAHRVHTTPNAPFIPFSLPFSVSFFLSLPRPLPNTHKHTNTQAHTNSLPLTYTHAHTQYTPCTFSSLIHSLRHTHILSRLHINTQTHTPTHITTHSHIRTHTHSLYLSFTHAYHIHTHLLSLLQSFMDPLAGTHIFHNNLNNETPNSNA